MNIHKPYLIPPVSMDPGGVVPLPSMETWSLSFSMGDRIHRRLGDCTH